MIFNFVDQAISFYLSMHTIHTICTIIVLFKEENLGGGFEKYKVLETCTEGAEGEIAGGRIMITFGFVNPCPCQPM